MVIHVYVYNNYICSCNSDVLNAWIQYVHFKFAHWPTYIYMYSHVYNYVRANYKKIFLDLKWPSKHNFGRTFFKDCQVEKFNTQFIMMMITYVNLFNYYISNTTLWALEKNHISLSLFQHTATTVIMSFFGRAILSHQLDWRRLSFHCWRKYM